MNSGGQRTSYKYNSMRGTNVKNEILFENLKIRIFILKKKTKIKCGAFQFFKIFDLKPKLIRLLMLSLSISYHRFNIIYQ